MGRGEKDREGERGREEVKKRGRIFSGRGGGKGIGVTWGSTREHCAQSGVDMGDNGMQPCKFATASRTTVGCITRRSSHSSGN